MRGSYLLPPGPPHAATAAIDRLPEATDISHDMPSMSALIVPVPAAEQLVGSWRWQLDRAARWGIPAHLRPLGHCRGPQPPDVLLARRARLPGAPERAAGLGDSSRRADERDLYDVPDDGPPSARWQRTRHTRRVQRAGARRSAARGRSRCLDPAAAVRPSTGYAG